MQAHVGEHEQHAAFAALLGAHAPHDGQQVFPAHADLPGPATAGVGPRAYLRAHLQGPARRQDAKWTLYRGLFGRGLSREAILELFRVLDWLLALPPSLERELAARIARHEEEVRMPYVTSVERIGREKGLEEGREKGLEEGVLRGRHETLRLIVSTRWGAPSSSLDERLRAAVAGPDFAAVTSQATSAPSLEAFAAWLSARASAPG